MSNYKYRPNPPIPKNIPVDESGAPIYYNLDDRAVEVVQEFNKEGEKVWIARSRDRMDTFSLAQIMQVGHPITKEEFLSMTDRIEEVRKERKKKKKC